MLRLLFFSTIMLVGLVSSLWSRFAALLTYVWFALFRPQEWVWFDISSLRLSLIVALLLVVPSMLTGIWPNLTHPISIGAAAFLTTAVVAQVVTPLPGPSWPWLDTFSRLILVMLMAITLLNTRRRVVLFIAVIAASMGFHTAKAGLVSMLGGGVYFAEGLAGSFTDNNGYAMAAAMTLPLLVCVWQNADRSVMLERWVARGFLIAVPLSLFTIIGTMSRAGFLAAAAALLAFVAVQRRRLLPVIGITLLIVVGLPFVPIPEGYFDRLETIRTYDEVNEVSAMSRLHFWEVAARMAEDNPLGVGLRNYDHLYDRYDFLEGDFGTGRSVHSSHFEVLAELGYAGALVWVALFVYAIPVAWRVRRFGAHTPQLAPDEARFYVTTANALIASMVAFLVGGAFIALALNDITWYTFAAVAAIDRLARARKQELDQSEAPPLATEAVFLRRATA